MKQFLKFFAPPIVAALLSGVIVAWAAQTNYLGTVFIADSTTPSQQLKVNSDGSLNVSGSFSASTTGFAPSLSYATCTSTNSACSSTALPTNTGSVILFNTGTTTVSCTLASGAATGTTGKLQIPASSGLPLATVYGATTYDHFACIDQTGSTSNVVIASGGSGLATGWGGGGSSGGGGLSVPFAGAIGANGTPGGFQDGSGNFQSFLGDVTNGQWISVKASVLPTGAATAANQSLLNTATGAPTDSVCGTATGTCSMIALQKYLNNAAVAAVPWLATTAWSTNSYSNGTTNPGAADLHGAPFVDIGAVGGTALALGQTTKSASVPVVLPSDQTVTTVTAAADPCQGNAQIILPISITSNTTTNILTGTSAKKIYVCYLYLQTAAANNVAIIEGTTGATCGTSTKALIGGTTAANGLNDAANSGQALGNGGYSVLQTTVNNNDICIITSANTVLAGVMKYVLQ